MKLFDLGMNEKVIREILANGCFNPKFSANTIYNQFQAIFSTSLYLKLQYLQPKPKTHL